MNKPSKASKPRRRRATLRSHHSKADQIEANLDALIKFPGLNLAKLYRGIIDESRQVGDYPGSPSCRYSVELIDKCTAKILQVELAKPVPDARMVARLQRGIYAAEAYRVSRYVAESTLGAAALAIDGVNRLLQLRGELKAEKAGGETIDSLAQ